MIFSTLVMCPKTDTRYGFTEACGLILKSRTFDEHGKLCPQDGTVYKLESWKEGGYLVSDKNNPGGEIMFSSKTLAKGYYKLEDGLSNASSSTDSEDVQWFRTGDIAQLNPINGTLRIVHRRKELNKLKMGKYVSLTKV